jgi:DNA-binding transcriptional regulator YdaS (Cro superfamily)
MHEILEYLRGLALEERTGFAERCGTSVGYLRKAVSAKQQLGIEMCIRLDRESGGALRCERLYPSLDWDYLRAVALRGASGPHPQTPPALTPQAQAAINSEAREPAQEVV